MEGLVWDSMPRPVSRLPALAGVTYNRWPVLAWTAMGGVPAAVEQFAVPVVPLVCLEATVGNDSLPVAGTGVLVRLRLLVSPVVPVTPGVLSGTHEGAAELVVVRAVCACSVVLLPKYASAPPASPYTPHSVWFQYEARWNMLSLAVTKVACPEPVVSDTLSLPPDMALPDSWTVASCAADSVVTWVAELFLKQLMVEGELRGTDFIQPEGQVASYSCSQYCMYMELVPLRPKTYRNCCHVRQLAGSLLPAHAGG